MNIGKTLTALMAFAGLGMAAAEDKPQGRSVKSIDFKPRTAPVPKGCKEYFFNEHGGFSTQRMKVSELYFKCVALNHTLAIKKFNNYKTKSQSTNMKNEKGSQSNYPYTKH